MNEDTASLVERAQKGDAKAFEALLASFQDTLQRHVRVRLGEHLRSKVDVEDVLQETYARAWKSIDRFRWAGSGSLLKWLEGISEHVILYLASLQCLQNISENLLVLTPFSRCLTTR